MAAYRMFPPVGPDRADELAAGDKSVGVGPIRTLERLISVMPTAFASKTAANGTWHPVEAPGGHGGLERGRKGWP